MWSSQDDQKLVDLCKVEAPMVSICLILKRDAESCKKRIQELEEQRKKNENLKYLFSVRRDVSLCLICPKQITGRIIGKQHKTINAIREKSGAMITIRSDNDEDDMVIISASEICELHSPVEYAADLLFPFSTDASGGSHRIRLLVESITRSECLDEHFIYELKQTTEAGITISSKGDNHIVEITGSKDMVNKAFIKVVLRLRRHAFKQFRFN